MIFEAELAETSFLLAVWCNRLPFPICQHSFSLGSWHNLFPGKESHSITLHHRVKKGVKGHVPLQEEGKDLS